MTRLLVTGASGLLGVNLALLAAQKGYDVIGWTNRERLVNAPFETASVDLTDFDEIGPHLEAAKPDLIIHCAALTNVDQAETNGRLSYLLNAEAPGYLASAAARNGAKLIHISTDAVFDGSKGDYSEEDMPHPLNTYAHSKLKGEEAIASANPDAIIARVVFYGWSIRGNRSLAEFFYNHLSAEQTVNGFTDMFFTPLYDNHLAGILLEMAEKNLSGLYHVFGSTPISKYAFGVALAREFGLDESLVSPISALEAGLATRRPLNLSMRTDKLSAALGHEIPTGTEGLRALADALREGLREKLASLAA